jgi:hypothetical protein
MTDMPVQKIVAIHILVVYITQQIANVIMTWIVQMEMFVQIIPVTQVLVFAIHQIIIAHYVTTDYGALNMTPVMQEPALEPLTHVMILIHAPRTHVTRAHKPVTMITPAHA